MQRKERKKPSKKRVERSDACCNLGYKYLKENNDAAAKQAFDDALMLNSENALALYYRGYLYLVKMGLYTDAINDFLKCTILEPCFAEAYRGLGLCYFRLGQYGLSGNSYTQAIFIAPDHAKTLCSRGHVYKIQGKFIEAILDYADALDLEPDDYNARNHLKNILSLNTPQVVFDAIKTLDLEDQVFLLKQALDDTTILGEFFNQSERPWRSKSRCKGDLNGEIWNYLAKIDPGFSMVSPVSITNVSIFSANQNSNDAAHVNDQNHQENEAKRFNLTI